MGAVLWSVLRDIRPRHGTIVAYLALTAALSGVAYAAGTVGSKDIVDNSIQSVDLKDGAAVRGVDVVNDSLTGADISERSLQGVSHRLFFTRSAGAPRQVLPTLGGYRIAAQCQDGVDIENGIVLAFNRPS